VSLMRFCVVLGARAGAAHASICAARCASSVAAGERRSPPGAPRDGGLAARPWTSAAGERNRPACAWRTCRSQAISALTCPCGERCPHPSSSSAPAPGAASASSAARASRSAGVWAGLSVVQSAVVELALAEMVGVRVGVAAGCMVSSLVASALVKGNFPRPQLYRRYRT
jgi:hypothetical protein